MAIIMSLLNTVNQRKWGMNGFSPRKSKRSVQTKNRICFYILYVFIDICVRECKFEDFEAYVNTIPSHKGETFSALGGHPCADLNTTKISTSSSSIYGESYPSQAGGMLEAKTIKKILKKFLGDDLTLPPGR